MEPQYEHLSREELAEKLGKSERLFGVAYGTLLRISSESFPPELVRQAVDDAVALIKRYPNDERYIAGYKAEHA